MGILKEQINGSIISIEIESSNLSSAEYNTETKNLTVIFKNNSIYEYENVPWEIFTKLRMAQSQGSYFSKNIARKYSYKKIK